MLREDGTVMCWGNNYYVTVGYTNASGGVNPVDVTLYGYFLSHRNTIVRWRYSNNCEISG